MSDGSISSPEAAASAVSDKQTPQQPETTPPKQDLRARILGLFGIGSNRTIGKTGEIQGTLPPTQEEVHKHNTGIAQEALISGVSLKSDGHGMLQKDPKAVYAEDQYIKPQDPPKN